MRPQPESCRDDFCWRDWTLQLKAATAVCLEALDDSENPQLGCICKKASQAAEESWQQTVQGHNVPTVMNPTVSEIEQSGSASCKEYISHTGKFY